MDRRRLKASDENSEGKTRRTDEKQKGRTMVAPAGFEPATSGLRGQRPDRARRRGRQVSGVAWDFNTLPQAVPLKTLHLLVKTFRPQVEGSRGRVVYLRQPTESPWEEREVNAQDEQAR